MITSEGIKKKFELYRKWFNTFLAEEFLNLPIKEQKKFLMIAEKFMENCKRVHEEAKNIKEQTFNICIKEIQKNCIIGEILETKKEVKIHVVQFNKDIPKIGESIVCLLFSMDEKSWYSSKYALITGRY